jgi:acyl-CoA synthetase (AMP-forming)/AMP-acid ligase II
VNLADNLPGAAAAPDDAGLLHTVDATMTAGAARAAVEQFRTSLVQGGTGARHAVAVQLPNGPEFVTAMFGTWRAGAVFVPVNPRATPREVDEILVATGATALVTRDGRTRTGSDLDREYGEDDAFITWTSGTTGRPRPIVQTHSGYTELLDRLHGPLRATRDATRDATTRPSPNLIPVSLALNAGIYNVLFGLRAGAEIVIMDRFATSEFAALVARFAIRSTILPPTALAMLNDDPGVVDLTPLRYVRSVTAPLSPLQARRFTEKFGVTVLNGYGQAEVGEVIGWTAADAREHPEKIGAVGRAHAGVDVKIVDDAGASVPGDTVGRLLVRPPRMAAGYASGAQLGDRIDADGFLDTGDLARVDPDGFVWIEGRASDMINRGGNKVFPDEVEEVLRLSPAIRDVAVVGRPDDRLGEVPVAFVVGEPEPPGALDALCRDHLVPYKVPVEFVYLDVLPRNETGKLLRRELVDRSARHPR